LMVAALVLASCAPAAVEEGEEVLPEEGEEVVEEEVAPGPEVPQYGGTGTIPLSLDILAFDETFKAHYECITIHYTNDELLQGDWTKGPAGTGETDWIQADINRMDLKTGALAESWEIPEQGKMIFTIRKGVHWHDKPPVNGRELTPDDVVFSLNRVITSSRCYVKQAYPGLAAATVITAPGDGTVVIECPPEEFINAVSIFPDFVSIVPPEVIEQYGDQNDWRNSLGTGEFMLTDFVSNSSATLVRNPNYYMTDPIGPGKGNQLPYLDGIKFLIIPDASTKLAALRTGRVDVLGFARHVDAVDLIEDPKIDIKWRKYQFGGCYAMFMRTDLPESPFSDVRVRQAMMLAIEQAKVKDDYYLGEAVMQCWPIAPTMEYADAYVPLEELPQNVQELYGYDPDKAKELLADAGYPDGFEVSIICYDDPVMMDILSMYQAMLAKVGIEMALDVKDYAVYRGKAYTRNYDPYELMYTTNAGTGTYNKMINFRGTSMFNVSHVDDPVVEEAYQEMQQYVGIDEQKMMEVNANLMPYLLEQAYVIPTPASCLYTVWNPWIKNYHGEGNVGYYNGNLVCGAFKYVWMDQALKKEMTGK